MITQSKASGLGCTLQQTPGILRLPATTSGCKVRTPWGRNELPAGRSCRQDTEHPNMEKETHPGVLKLLDCIFHFFFIILQLLWRIHDFCFQTLLYFFQRNHCQFQFILLRKHFCVLAIIIKLATSHHERRRTKKPGPCWWQGATSPPLTARGHPRPGSPKQHDTQLAPHALLTPSRRQCAPSPARPASRHARLSCTVTRGLPSVSTASWVPSSHLRLQKPGSRPAVSPPCTVPHCACSPAAMPHCASQRTEPLGASSSRPPGTQTK